MKFLIFADLHAHKWKRHSKLLPPDGRNDRLLDTVEVLKAIQRGVKKHDIDRVVFLGDLFHQRGEIDIETWNVIVPELREIGRLAELHLLVGNHDMATANLDTGGIQEIYTPFQEIQEHNANIKVWSQPGWIQDDLVYFFLPYVDSNENMAAAIDEFMRTTFTKRVVVFTHIGIREAQAQKGIRLRNALDVSFFDTPFFEGIFSGHYHIPQKIKFGKVPFWYVGAPHQHNWGDAGQERGYMLLDTETFKVKRVRLHCAPKFVVLQKGQGVTEADVEGNFVKQIVPRGTGKDVVMDLKEQFSEWGARDSIIEREYVPPTRQVTSAASLGNVSSLHMIDGYVSSKIIKKPKRAAWLISLGNEIFDEVVT